MVRSWRSEPASGVQAIRINTIKQAMTKNLLFIYPQGLNVCVRGATTREPCFNGKQAEVSRLFGDTYKLYLAQQRWRLNARYLILLPSRLSPKIGCRLAL